MSTNVILANGAQPTTTGVETLYTAPSNIDGTRIIGFTACNPSASPETYTVHVVPSGGSANNTNKMIDARSLSGGESDSPPEMQNHLIPSGGTLQVQVSTGTTINFRVTGIQF